MSRSPSPSTPSKLAPDSPFPVWTAPSRRSARCVEDSPTGHWRISSRLRPRYCVRPTASGLLRRTYCGGPTASTLSVRAKEVRKRKRPPRGGTQGDRLALLALWTPCSIVCTRSVGTGVLRTATGVTRALTAMDLRSRTLLRSTCWAEACSTPMRSRDRHPRVTPEVLRRTDTPGRARPDPSGSKGPVRRTRPSWSGLAGDGDELGDEPADDGPVVVRDVVGQFVRASGPCLG